MADDPTTTDCNESLLLQRRPDGTIAYRATNSVDPSGVNKQAVYDGTPGPDLVMGGTDSDTFWGGAGTDVIEGNGGNDVVLAGDGNDVVTDLDGADILEGGPGEDALDGGPGLDNLLGGDGSDVINGGAGGNIVFGGPGTDYVDAGSGTDTAQGDGGDDWIQGGAGTDALVGDHGAPFFDDPGQVAPGNDVLVGQAGSNKYDAEGGDDILASSPSVDELRRLRRVRLGDPPVRHRRRRRRHEHQPYPGRDAPGVVNRDSWQETEAVSGSSFDDVIRGDDTVPATVGGRAFTGCDVLDEAGAARIAGLGALLPTFTTPSGPVVAASRSGFCPISGPVWGAGNILLGGAGSDTLEGRGGDDVIDGDRALTVRISLRTDPADPATEIGSTDLMEHPLTGPFGTAHPGMTLQQAVFAGLVDPVDLVIVRQIDDPTPAPGTVDTAVFSGLRSEYDCIVGGVVTSPCGLTSDGGHHRGRARTRQWRGRHRHRPQHRAAAVRRHRSATGADRGDRAGRGRSGDRQLDRSGGAGDRLHGRGHEHEDRNRLLPARPGRPACCHEPGGHRPDQRHAVPVPRDGRPTRPATAPSPPSPTWSHPRRSSHRRSIPW